MATKINPGLVALSADTTDVSTPFTPTDPKLLSLAAEEAGKDPKKINVLSGMMQRMEDLQNPWKRFQGQMDEIVARSHFRPEAAMASVNEQQAKNAGELQNIGTTLAQLKFLQDQQAGIRAGFTGGPSGAGGIGGAGGAGGAGAGGVGGDPKAQSGYMYKGIPLTNMEYENLAMRGLDPAEFRAAFKDMTNINTREQAKWQGPEAYDSQAISISVIGPDGKPDTISVELTKAEIRDLKQGIFPKRLSDSGLSPATIKQKQKKASGGVVLQNHLAGGGQPIQPMGAEVEVGPLYTDAGVQMPNTAPVRQPGMLENALTALSGSGEAQASDWRTKFNSKLNQSEQEARQASELSTQKSGEVMQQNKNSAELKSTEKEREEAGQFIFDIGKEAVHYGRIADTAQRIIDKAKSNPKDFGYSFEQDSPLAIPFSLLGSIYGAGPSLQAGAEKVKAYALGDKNNNIMERRALINTDAQQLGLDFVRDMIKEGGGRMGLGLTNIISEAKGVGIANTAQQNILQATKVKYMAKEYYQLAQEWQEYSKHNPNPNPMTFMTTPKVRKIQAETLAKVKEETEPYLNKPKDGTKGTDKDGNEFVYRNGIPMRIKQ